MDLCPLRLRLTDPSDLDFSLGWTSHPSLPLDVQGRAGNTLRVEVGVSGWESRLKGHTLKGLGCRLGVSLCPRQTSVYQLTPEPCD